MMHRLFGPFAPYPFLTISWHYAETLSSLTRRNAIYQIPHGVAQPPPP